MYSNTCNRSSFLSQPLKCRWLVLPFVIADIPTCHQQNLTFHQYWSLCLPSQYHHGLTLTKKIVFWVILWSLARPLEPSEIKLIVPCGVIPIRYLIVLGYLYDDHVRRRAVRLFGRSGGSGRCIRNLSSTYKMFRRNRIMHKIICSNGGKTQFLLIGRVAWWLATRAR